MPGTQQTRSTDPQTYRGSRVRVGKAISEHKQFVTRMKRRVRNARRFVYGVAARGLVAVLKRVPFRVNRAWMRAIIVPIARAMFAREAEQNLIAAFGDRFDPVQRRAILRAMFRSLAVIPAEMLALVQQGEPFLEKLFAGDTGMTVWRQHMQAPGGVIGISGHTGNFEALLQWLHLRGGKPFGGAVAKRIPNPRLNALVEELRGHFGIPTLYGDSGVLKLARCVHDGTVLGLVPDQDMEELGGVFVEFFGRPAYTPTGPARLALATGAPLVVVVNRRVGDCLEVQAYPPIVPDRKAPRTAEIERLTRAWSRNIEQFLAENPEQWLWFHDRWATTPDKIAARAHANE